MKIVLSRWRTVRPSIDLRPGTAAVSCVIGIGIVSPTVPLPTTFFWWPFYILSEDTTSHTPKHNTHTTHTAHTRCTAGRWQSFSPPTRGVVPFSTQLSGQPVICDLDARKTLSVHSGDSIANYLQLDLQDARELAAHEIFHRASQSYFLVSLCEDAIWENISLKQELKRCFMQLDSFS